MSTLFGGKPRFYSVLTSAQVSDYITGKANTWNGVQTVTADSSQIPFGTAANQGFLTGQPTYAGFSFGGKYVSGSGWTATGVASAIFAAFGTDFRWYINTGLTVGNTYSITEQMRLTTAGLGVGVTAGCGVDSGSAIRAQGNSGLASGDGLEMQHYPGSYSRLLSYSRTGAAYNELRIDGLTVKIGASANYKVTVGSASVALGAPLDVQTCTTATRPANTAGRTVFDTTIGKLITNTGSGWVDGAGTAV